MAEVWDDLADRLDNPASDPEAAWADARRRWLAQARPETQIPPDDAPIWVYQAGRGTGKTRSATEAASEHCRTHPNARVALVGRSFSDGRDVLVEGAGSGLLAILPPSVVTSWNRSQGVLRLINGAMLSIYADTEPDRLRGPQFSMAVCDELASWQNRDAWDTLLLACRLGTKPQIVVTTTPRNTPLFRELVADPKVIVVRESTYANLHNLAPSFRDAILARYAGTTLGRRRPSYCSTSRAHFGRWRPWISTGWRPRRKTSSASWSESIQQEAARTRPASWWPPSVPTTRATSSRTTAVSTTPSSGPRRRSAPTTPTRRTG